MPNHCENRISISGSEKQIAAAKPFIVNEKGEVDFNLLIPMPEILKKTTSGSRTIDGQNVRTWITETGPDDKDVDRLPTEVEKLQIAATGAENWYDWSCDNWGTKWNAYDQEQPGHDLDTEYLALTFNTAWGPPEPWVQKLREKFPDLSIHGIYVIEFNEGAGEF